MKPKLTKIMNLEIYSLLFIPKFAMSRLQN